MFDLDSIKKFLKPNWSKVFIFIIIYLINLFISSILLEPGYNLLYSLFGNPCSSECKSFEGNGLTGCPLYDCISSPVWAESFSIIIYYLISCFLIFAWNKIRNKKPTI